MALPPGTQPSGRSMLIALWVIAGLLVVIVIGLGVIIIPMVQTRQEVGQARRKFEKAVSEQEEREKEKVRRLVCSNNLKQISLAILNYYDDNSAFPPAVTYDAAGKPMHSWRVLILPFIGEDNLYKQYHFDQPWDSTANRSLMTQMPTIYACPDDPTASPTGKTSYLALTGPGTVMDSTATVQTKDITDGTSNTIVLVESSGSNIGWTEPKDIDISQAPLTISTARRGGAQPGTIQSKHPGGANVTFADGSVRFLPSSTPPETLQAMATRNGGEAVQMP